VYVKVSTDKVRKWPADLEQRQRAQKKKARMPPAIEPFPRDDNE
jgi:hypothetical protein